MAEEPEDMMELEDGRLSSLLFNRKRYNILAYLLTRADRDDFITISDITDGVDSTRQHVTNFVNSLRDLGLVEKRKKGNMYLIRVNKDSPYFRPLRDLLKVDSEPLKNAAEEVAEEIMGEYGEGIISVYLFGSVARGTPRIDSDIDLLIIYREDEFDDEKRQKVEGFVRKREDRFKTIISITWYSEEEWKRSLRGGIALPERILEEGKRLEGDKIEA